MTGPVGLDVRAVLGYAGGVMGEESNSGVIGPESIGSIARFAAELSVIEFDEFSLVADPTLVLEPRFDDEQQIVELDIVELGIFVSGSTREELMAELHDHLEFAWIEYAEAEDSELSQDARDIKRALLSRFQRIHRSNEGR